MRLSFLIVVSACFCEIHSGSLEKGDIYQIPDSQGNSSQWDLEKFDDTPPAKKKTVEPEEICYGIYGCYNNTIGDTLPSRPETIAPFYSFNANGETQVNISYDAEEAEVEEKLAHFFNKERPLILVAHGFGESLKKPWVWDMSAALLDVYPDAVTVLIDWENGCFKPLYARAAANVALTARITNVLFDKIFDNFATIKSKNIYFIGFSLGGQFAGFFGRQYKLDRSERLGRMTILDAAAPHFENINIMPRRGEADYVEAIHTSAGNSIITGKFGVVQAFADIDFYPNGGTSQPSCPFFNIVCSHGRAFRYFIQALLDLKNCQMKGVRCNNVTDALTQKCDGPADPTYLGMKDYSSVPIVKEDRIISFKTSGHEPYCLQ